MYPHIHLLLTFLAVLSGVHANPTVALETEGYATVRTIYQFPNDTWVENLAVRSSGTILVTLFTTPEVWEIDPVKKSAQHITTFPGATGALGIVEVEPDVFTVNVGNFSIATESSVPGSYSVWKLAFTEDQSAKATAAKITDIPAAQFLNGMCVLPGENENILTADSGQGLIYRLDTATGDYRVWLEDPAFKPNSTANPKIGINGIRTLNDSLYFTNSLKTPVFGRVPFSSVSGEPVGPVEVIVSRASYPLNLGFSADDFALDSEGNAWVATDPSNLVVKIAPDGSQTIIAGGSKDPVVAGGTAAVFGRTAQDKATLYVTTNGGLADPASAGVQGGKLVAINVA